MLSTIVFLQDESAGPARADANYVVRLVRSLASLIAANVEGLLRDVAIAGPRGQGLDIVADEAGCGLIEAETEAQWLRLALEAARGPDILLLRAGRAPEAGFIEEARDFLARRGSGHRAARLHAVPETLFERLFPDRAPLAGLIAPRELYLRAPATGFPGLARAIGPAAAFRARARRT
ncbi:hypothetical protein [Methylocapsa acidiphila]|uniref:hypothetical protein n=1 Tax=Methylocapsa acidiphila TaxID=133552 RepID=UPI00041A501A|nr:hypothetical protein [Methylocapsa acidiphila]